MEVVTQYIASNKILIFTFLFVTLGVVFNDYHKTIGGKDEDIYIIRIVFASIVITMLMRGFSDKILEMTNRYIYFFMCVAGGWANYSIYDLLDLIGNNFVDNITKYIKSLAKQHINDNNTDNKIKELEDKINELDDK